MKPSRRFCINYLINHTSCKVKCDLISWSSINNIPSYQFTYIYIKHLCIFINRNFCYCTHKWKIFVGHTIS
jgi:hypothetical protein